VAYPVRRLLIATPAASANDDLCPWVRGESVSDEQIARWVRDGLISWSVVEIGEETTFAGRPLADALAFAEADDALRRRCDVEPPSRECLLVAGADVPYKRVADAIYELGKSRFERPWLLVADPAPEVWPVEPRAPETAEPIGGEGTTTSAPAFPLSFILRSLEAESALPAGFVASDEDVYCTWPTAIVGPPARLRHDCGLKEADLAAGLAAHRFTLVVVIGEPSTSWGAVVAAADVVHGVGAATWLAIGGVEGGEGAYPAGVRTSSAASASPPTPVSTRSASALPKAPVPLMGTVPALPIEIPTYR
jgi:hypothetical protein